MKAKWLVILLIIMLLIGILLIFRKQPGEKPVQKEESSEVFPVESETVFTRTNAPLPKPLTINKAITIIETGAREANIAVSQERKEKTIEAETRAAYSQPAVTTANAGNTQDDATPPESGITIIKTQPTPEEARQMNEKGIIIF